MYFITNPKLLYHYFLSTSNQPSTINTFLNYNIFVTQKSKSKRLNQKSKYLNVWTAKIMAIHALTVTVHLDAFAVVIITVQPLVWKARTFQQNAPFDHPANYRGCPALKNIQTHRNRHSKVNNNHRLNNNNKFYENNTNVITHSSPNSASENQSIPITTNLFYAQATQNKNHTENNNQPQLDSTSSLTAQLTSFINNLKTLITPLITLLTKVIDKVFEKKWLQTQ